MIGGEFDISLDRLPGNYDISFCRMDIYILLEELLCIIF